MNKYPITYTNKNKEETIIRTILHNNSYPQNITQQKQEPPEKNNKQQKRKWATFTFFGPKTRTITKLFKNTEIGISYRTKNNIKHLLRIKENDNGKYNQLQCADCPWKYVGQTGRTFKTRFKEHIRDIKNNRQNSKFAHHILDTTHEYETMEKSMKSYI
jgi:hypothetical protein